MATYQTTELAVALIVGVESDPSRGSADVIWAPVLGRPLLAWSVEAFLRCGEVPLERQEPDDPDAIAIAQVILVVAPERVADAEALCDHEGWSAPPRQVFVVPGGPRRRDAVRAGLVAITTSLPASSPPGKRSNKKSLTVVIHDAARPLVTHALIEVALAASTRASAATAVEPVKETLKLVRDGRVAATLPRERVVRAQTPQVFHLDTLLVAHDACDSELDPPDAAALVQATGLPLATFPGSPENLKVRTTADLAVVERLLATRQAI